MALGVRQRAPAQGEIDLHGPRLEAGPLSAATTSVTSLPAGPGQAKSAALQPVT